MSDLIKDLDHWTAEMDRAASTAEQEGLGLEVIDGNRACATVLRNAAKALTEAFKASAHWMKRTHELGDELQRLSGVLARIEGGDHPCTNESLLRQWAYEALTLGRGVTELSKETRL